MAEKMDDVKTHSKEQKPFICDQCGKLFTSHLVLTLHKITHSADFRLKREECGKSVNTSERIHKKRSFNCEECGKGFPFLSNLIRHKKIHTEGKLFRCDVCGKTFSDLSNWKVHKRIHSGDYRFKCEVCGKGFNKSGIFYAHKERHRSEKLFVCKICDKKFSELSHLENHKLAHTGEKTFECKECGMLYTHLPNLIMHKRVHLIKKPHPSDDTQLFNGRIIKRSQTAKNILKCENCGDDFTGNEDQKTNKINIRCKKCESVTELTEINNPDRIVEKGLAECTESCNPVDSSNDSNEIVSFIKIEPEDFGSNNYEFEVDSQMVAEEDIKLETTDN